MFRELSQGKKAGTPHHLITVWQTLANRLQHRWQHPDRQSHTLLSKKNTVYTCHCQNKYCIKMTAKHTWCVCGRHILLPGQQDTRDPPSADMGFHWPDRLEWEASGQINVECQEAVIQHCLFNRHQTAFECKIKELMIITEKWLFINDSLLLCFQVDSYQLLE